LRAVEPVILASKPNSLAFNALPTGAFQNILQPEAAKLFVIRHLLPWKV
jgi:hypothetical protein